MLDERRKNGVSSWRSVGPIGSMQFLFALIFTALLTACTDYVQQMDDGFEEWEKSHQLSELSSSSQTEISSSSVESKSSSSSVILSSNSREKSSSSTEKKISSSSNKKTSSSSTKSSSSNKVSSSSEQKNKSSSSVKATSSSSKVTSSSSKKSSSSSLKTSSSSKKNEVSSSSENLKISSSGKASWAYLNPAISYEEIIDERDGQVYKTVKIGEQTWMAENLNFETQNSYCYDNQDSNCLKYGRLYTWSAAMDSAGTWSTNGYGCGLSKTCSPTYPVRGACPTGWHLPTKVEFGLLEYNTDRYQAGYNLKSTCCWNSDYTGSDKYGFSLLPAGHRSSDGNNADENTAVLWTSSDCFSEQAYMMYLLNYQTRLNFNSSIKNEGNSVRCVKD